MESHTQRSKLEQNIQKANRTNYSAYTLNGDKIEIY